MNRIGVLLVFKPDVSETDAKAALANLQGMVDPKFMWIPNGPRVVTENPAEMIQPFDDDYGGPTWYIP